MLNLKVMDELFLAEEISGLHYVEFLPCLIIDNTQVNIEKRQIGQKEIQNVHFIEKKENQES